ncbi:MAG: hypothetical protein SF339_02905 [Blastocatellia bacterium]|nr:hypothetical protein [Blastocatellia bacterium]
MSRNIKIFFLLFLLATGAAAQDPLKSLPKNYRLEFENEWVKVVRVHYGAREKIAAHDHAEWGTAYVYLNDAGPVIFRHIGLSYGAITRPAVKAGSFRLYKSVREVHEVENPSDTPSDFLRVEFKTEPVNEKSLHGKFHRESAFEPAQPAKIQFENEQVRVTRLLLAPGAKLAIAAGAEPALLVALTEAKLRARSLAMGQTRWIAAKKEETLENAGAAPIELLRFDLRTPPAKARPADPAHKHPHD